MPCNCAPNRCAAIERYPVGWRDHGFHVTASVGVTAPYAGGEDFAARPAVAGRQRLLLPPKGTRRQPDSASPPFAGAGSAQRAMRWGGTHPRGAGHGGSNFAGRSRRWATNRSPAAIEVLLRMRDPGTGRVSPGVFIPANERFHLGVRLDRHVIELALGWFRIPSGRGRGAAPLRDQPHRGVDGRRPVPPLPLDRVRRSVQRTWPVLRDHREQRGVRPRGSAVADPRNCARSAARSRSTTSAPGSKPVNYLRSLDVDRFQDRRQLRGADSRTRRRRP